MFNLIICLRIKQSGQFLIIFLMETKCGLKLGEKKRFSIRNSKARQVFIMSSIFKRHFNELFCFLVKLM